MVDGNSTPLANTTQGAYTYNTANAAGHLHAVSSVGSGSTSYSAAYDAAGDMTCRAVGSLSCTTNGSPTGQVLGYDALRRLISWQNASSLPTATASYAYDGEGQRVWQQSVSGPGGAQTTTTTVYLLGHDEQTTTQVSGQQATVVATRYYPTPGGALAVRDATGLSYLSTDHLGTPIATVNLDTGALLGEQLRAPYGGARYAVSANNPNGGMHTTFGFTGQRLDPSGLYYFHARYYDPTSGRFTSADTLLGADPAFDGYAYVGGMVESVRDPSGHCLESGSCGSGGIDDGNLLAEDFETCRPYCGSHFIDPDYVDFFDLEPGIQVEIADTTTTTEISITEDGVTTTTETVDTTTTDSGADPLEGGARAGRPTEPTTTSTSGDPTTTSSSGDTGSTSGQNGSGTGNGGSTGSGSSSGSPPTQMNPNDINYTQKTASNQGNGYTVQGNIEGLQDGTLKPGDLPNIRVFVKTPDMDNWGSRSKYGFTGDPANLENGQVYTLDNRRLYAFRQAGVPDISVDWVDDPTIIHNQRWKFTTENGGSDITLVP